MFQFSNNRNSKLIHIVRPEHRGLEEYAELTRKKSDLAACDCKGQIFKKKKIFGEEHNWDDEKMPQLLANDQKFG